MANLNLIDVCKVYKGNVKAVKDFNLEIRDGEFLVFVGPSGCGKSTTLRMIAGLEDITSGKIYIEDKLINHLEPKDRDIAMVFQNYALYPHMSVFENLAYSLKCHRVDKVTIKQKVEEVAEILDIKEYLLRKPKELSGGQRQRVALGRCLIRNPKVFLFDEPLSNLDAKLRVTMRSEISKLHKKVNGTFIYVTHDQTEAMTMGDRIVVMKDGLIQQVDTPVNLYEHPVNIFVATFLGSPQMNIFQGHLLEDKVILHDTLSLQLSEKIRNKLISGYENQEIYLGIRPNDFSLGNAKDYDIHVKVDLIEKLGSETLLYFQMPGREESTVASIHINITDDLSEDVYLKIDKEKLHLFNRDEESILKINEINFIKTKISLDKEDAILNHQFRYQNFVNQCVDENIPAEFHGYMALPSQDFSLVKQSEDDIELEVEIRAFDAYSDKKVYYSKLFNEEESRITFFSKRNENLTKGDQVKIYFPSKKLSIYDASMLKITINDPIFKPIQVISLTTIGKEYYILDSNKDFCKNKYFKIEKIFDLNTEMIVNVKNQKDENYSFRIDKNPDLYVGLLLYTKHLKR